MAEIQQLRARVARLETEAPAASEIIEKAPVMIAIMRAPDFVYELVNPAFQALAPGKEFLGRKFADVWAEVAEPLVDILQSVIATGQTFDLKDAPYTIQRGPGMPPELVYVTYSWIPLFDAQGKPDRVLTLAHDVTHAVLQRQKLAESIDELRRTEAEKRKLLAAVNEERDRLSAIIASINDEVWLADTRGRFVLVNPVATREFLLDSSEPVDVAEMTTRLEVLRSDGSPRPVEEAPALRALKGEVVTREEEIIRTPGTRQFRHREISAAPVKDACRGIIGSVSVVRDITDRKYAEQALRESDQRFRALMQNLQTAVALLDETGAFQIVNSSFRRMFDIPQDADISNVNSLAWSAWKVFDEQGALLDLDAHPVRKAALSCTAVRNQLVAVQPPGSTNLKWMLISAEPVLNPEGRLRQLICTYYDITERKLAEEERRRRAEEIERLLETAPAAVWVAHDPQCQNITGNSRANEFYEAESGENVSATAFPETRRFFTADGRELSADELPMQRAVAANEDVRDVELHVQTPSGRRIAMLGNAAPLRDGAGKVRGCIGTFLDITERKRMEEALRLSLERLEKVLDVQTVGVMFWDLSTGCMVDANNAFINLMGYSRSEVEARELTWQRLTPAEYIDVSLAEIEKFRVTGRVGPYEKEYFQKDGSRRWLLFAGSSLGGDLCVEFCVDISARKRAEEALRESEERLRLLGNNLPDSAVYQYAHEADGSARFLYFSEGIERLNGVTAADVVRDASTLHSQIPPEYMERFVQEEKRSKRDLSDFNMELPMRRPDGEVRWMRIQSRPRRMADGRTIWDGVQTDITEEKKAEEKLRQSQKLESIGLLAGGIAHDFNNLLTSVMGNASLLLENAAPGSADSLRSIIASTERATHLTRQLLAYSGKGQFIIRELDVSQAINEMADLVQFSIPKSVSLALTLERRLPPVAMDPGQLQQILMNLVINAGEAIGDGNPGRITVTTSMADLGAPVIDELGQELAPGRYISIEVHDTGGGIEPDKKAKIFDPFFTTKFIGRGLGLSAVSGILRAQNGGIVVQSEPGIATTFRVFLPAVPKNGSAVYEPEPQDGRPLVLVVDDELPVLDFIGEVLRRKGFQALQASDGQEALALCGSAPGAIGAAIVDIVMPNMSANDLLPALKAKQPGIRILLTSGYSEAEARRLCAAYPGAAFIQKPYTAQQLAKAVDELVGGAEASGS